MDALAALLKTTTKEWLSAHAAWEAFAPANPLAQMLRLQTATRVGDQALTRNLVAQVFPAFQLLPAGRQIVQEAGEALAIQDAAPVPPELTGRQLGRFLVESRRYLDALSCWLSVQDAPEERGLRLAQLYVRLGEYRNAILEIKACEQTKYAERTALLLPDCEAGLERIERLANRRPELLPHPLLKDLREAIVEGEALPLAAQCLLALAWCDLLGDWGDFVLVLRRGLLMDDDLILLETPAVMEAGLLAFAKSAAFGQAASPRLVDYWRRCLVKRKFQGALSLLTGGKPTPLSSSPE